MVEFDADRIGAALGIPGSEVIARMLRVLSGALAFDAAQLAHDEMRAQGLVMGRDGYPEGWPHEHIAAVCIHRLFPERAS